MTNSLELSSILRQTPFSNLYFIPWTANPSYTDMIIFPHFKPSSAAFSPFPLTTLYLIDKVIIVLHKIFYLHLYAACSIKPITLFYKIDILHLYFFPSASFSAPPPTLPCLAPPRAPSPPLTWRARPLWPWTARSRKGPAGTCWPMPRP